MRRRRFRTTLKGANPTLVCNYDEHWVVKRLSPHACHSSSTSIVLTKEVLEYFAYVCVCSFLYV